MSEIRGASKINDIEFLAAYNDKTKTNLQVIEALSTDWTAVGVKLRSARVTLHTTVNRTGGKGGNYEDRPEPLALEARIWLKNGTVQPQPNGVYTSLETRIQEGKITVDADLNITEASQAPAASTTTTPQVATEASQAAPAKAAAAAAAAQTTGQAAPAATGTTAKAAEFAFTAEIFGSSYRLAGPTKEDALHALFTKLQELNFSKVAITNRRTGGAIGINDIQNGGEYKLAKQLTAAGEEPTSDEINAARCEADACVGSKWPGMTFEQGVAAALAWVLGDASNPMTDD